MSLCCWCNETEIKCEERKRERERERGRERERAKKRSGIEAIKPL